MQKLFTAFLHKLRHLVKPDPLDIASWAIKLLRLQNFHCDDESQFFDAFLKAYRVSDHFLAEFKNLEKTSCPKLYDQS